MTRQVCASIAIKIGIFYSQERESQCVCWPSVRSRWGDFIFMALSRNSYANELCELFRPEGVAFYTCGSRKRRFEIHHPGHGGWMCMCVCVCERAFSFWFSSFTNLMHALNAFYYSFAWDTECVLVGAVEVDFLNNHSGMESHFVDDTHTHGHLCTRQAGRHRQAARYDIAPSSHITRTLVYILYSFGAPGILWNTTPRPAFDAGMFSFRIQM